MARDRVCGMKVNPEDATARREYGGHTFYFYSGKCVAEFDRDPDRYGAPISSGGLQEAMVLVKGGYTPNVIVVEPGKPVRLSFVRAESASCSEMVLFPDFQKSAKLPEGETVPVEFLPDRPGEFEFQSQMGMFRGRLIVE